MLSGTTVQTSSVLPDFVVTHQLLSIFSSFLPHILDAATGTHLSDIHHHIKTSIFFIFILHFILCSTKSTSSTSTGAI